MWKANGKNWVCTMHASGCESSAALTGAETALLKISHSHVFNSKLLCLSHVSTIWNFCGPNIEIRQTQLIDVTFMGLGYHLIIHRLTVDNVQFRTCSFRKLITDGTDKEKGSHEPDNDKVSRFLSGRHPCYQRCRRSPPGSMSLHGAATEVAPMWSSSADTV